MDGVQRSQQQIIIPLKEYDEQVTPKGSSVICAGVKTMCEWMDDEWTHGWMDGRMDGEIRYTWHAQRHTHAYTHSHTFK